MLVFSPYQRMGLSLLILGYASAWITSQLTLVALVPLIFLGLAAYLIATQEKWPYRILGHALFISLALALSLHRLPGFNNPKIMDAVRLTADAIPFTMHLNLDKSLVGFWIVFAWPALEYKKVWRTWLTTGVIAGLLTATLCIGIAFFCGILLWAPKWPSSAWIWVVNNLLLVTFAEEAFFRGYIQSGLNRLLAKRRYGHILALFIASLLFGIAHFAGGGAWVLLASIAGLGYGLAYCYGGLQSAMLAHFILNLIHFGLFTYPMLTK